MHCANGILEQSHVCSSDNNMDVLSAILSVLLDLEAQANEPASRRTCVHNVCIVEYIESNECHRLSAAQTQTYRKYTHMTT